MIPVSLLPGQTASWQDHLQSAVQDPAELCRILHIPPASLGNNMAAGSGFGLKVPLPYLDRIERGNPADPLLLQILPVAAELQEKAGFSADPLDESRYNPVPGIIHKYRNRVLLVVSPLCAVHCRYCFRRHFPYTEQRNNREQWLEALEYVRCDTSINEVIFSGGDPLSLPDRQLAWLAAAAAAIPHVKRLRIHTRLPIVIPQRITTECIDWMTGTRLQTIVVLHANHPNEIDIVCAASIRRLVTAGITVLNQSVLLKGINDNAIILAALSESLFAAGALPYYLHLLDPVAGSAHFDVPLATATGIYGELMQNVPGFLLPRLVREEPGAMSKTPVSSLTE